MASPGLPVHPVRDEEPFFAMVPAVRLSLLFVGWSACMPTTAGATA